MILTRRSLPATTLALPAMARAGTFEEPMRLRCRFADQDFTYALIDTATTRDLTSLLPTALTIEDFSTDQKVAQLPRRLDEGGPVDFNDEAPGDLCYFIGLGNLAFFHAGYTYRRDLSRTQGPVTPLLVRGAHPLQLDLS